MKIFIFAIIILSSLPSCLLKEHEPTKKEKLEVFQMSKFDAALLNDKSMYIPLLNKVLENLDSILQYNRSNNYSESIDSIFYLIQTGKLVVSKEKGNTLVRFDINRYKRQNKILECHLLYWHDAAGFECHESFDFIKDTALSKNYVYRIGITTDNSGW